MAVELGRYELLRPIAQGGMATVYLARVLGEGGFERLVALKLMHPHIASQPEFVSMFLDEARLAARIRHPNVVPTLAIERSPQGLFLVMEYIDGHALHPILRATARAGTAIPFGITLRIMLDALEGLHAAHELKDERGMPLSLVHRDMSPQNVLVGTDGVARITDFGVAHARARLSSTQGASLKGKVAYLSPEQIVSGSVDRRCDVFAAGIVLWEMLTGRRLFRGETEGQTIAQIIGGVRKSPSQKNPNVPEPISQACMHALLPEPEHRYASAVEFADALEAAARYAGIEIAKPREVGAFVVRLNIQEPVLDGKIPGSSSAIHWARSAESGMPISASVAAPMVASARAPGAKKSPLVAGAVIGLVLAVPALIGVVFALRARATAQAKEPPAAAAAPARPSTNEEPIAAAPPAPSAVEPTPSATPAVESAKPSPTNASSPARSGRGAPARETTEPARPARAGTGYRPESL